MMKHEVLNVLEAFADAYIDDVEIDTSTTFEQHLIDLRRVLIGYVKRSYAQSRQNAELLCLW